MSQSAPEKAQESRHAHGSGALIWLPLAVLVAITGLQLFGPVPFGLANNNDFARVLGPLRLWPAPPFRNDPNVNFRYFVDDYVVDDPMYDTGVPGSEQLIARLAKSLARLILPAGTFRLRLMGFIHAAILTLALFIFLRALRSRAWWLRIVCALLLIFIWTDLEYVQQFNTAYPDAGAVVALAVVFSAGVHCLLTGGSGTMAPLSALCGCFLLATKTQHETALPCLLALCILGAVRARDRFTRTAWLMSPVLLLGTAAWMIVKTPRDYRTAPAFTLVFYKLAVLSPNPRSVLAEFRMPEGEFLKYVGHYAYEPGIPTYDPKFRRRILGLVTPSSVASFYWRHPEMLTKVLLFDLREAAPDVDLSISGYGHLREEDVRNGKHPFELVAWNRFRHRLFTIAPLHLVYVFGLVILFSVFCILRPEIAQWFPAWPIALISTALAISSFLFASLLDGVETSRHLVFFQAATDLTIFSIALSILLGIENQVNGKTSVDSIAA